jgi:proline dehydrogenase
VSLLIDAEQSWFQPAIDVISLGLQQKYNHVDVADQPVVFSTYQCYLKNSLERLNVDVSKSKRLSFHLGSKLVRGAYMPRERARAIAKGYASPIHDTIQETHDCYNNAMEYLLRQMKSTKSPSIKVMCASHNRESIELSIKLFHELGLSNDSCDGLSFAQLYGMADDLTISLGENGGKGYNVYKYLPYGQIKEVVPYLLRRAQENADVLGKSKYEMELLFDELKDRCRIL